jgi:hypothetical protein
MQIHTWPALLPWNAMQDACLSLLTPLPSCLIYVSIARCMLTSLPSPPLTLTASPRPRPYCLPQRPLPGKSPLGSIIGDVVDRLMKIRVPGPDGKVVKKYLTFYVPVSISCP